MYDSDDDEEEIDESQLFDLKDAKVMQWVTKDRTVAQVRMADRNGLCDMKIYLLLCAKVLQMERDLGIYEAHTEEH